MDLAGVVVAEAGRNLEEENLVDKEVTLISRKLNNILYCITNNMLNVILVFNNSNLM